MSVLLIQPIFCANDNSFEQNKRSLLSILTYLDHYKSYDIRIIFGGYCHEDRYFEDLVKAINANNYSIELKKNITMERFIKNYGKAHIINTLFKKMHRDEKYLLTMDSDIVFDIEEKDLVNRLEKLADEVPNKFPGHELGMIALNQKEACCHVWKEMNRSMDINGEIVSWSSDYGGIAGGCLFISVDAFKKVGMYRVMGIYSGDDGYLLLDMNQYNMICVISKNISVIHPDNHKNDRYYKWKRNNLVKCRRTYGKAITEEEIEREVNKFEKFINSGSEEDFLKLVQDETTKTAANDFIENYKKDKSNDLIMFDGIFRACKEVAEDVQVNGYKKVIQYLTDADDNKRKFADLLLKMVERAI